MEKDSIFQNSFEEAFKDFQNSQLSAKLTNKFSPKPFYKKYRKLKRFSDVGSILFSTFSALTAFAFVFFVCLSLNFGFYPALVLSGLALSALEYSKRLILEPVVLDFLKFRKFRAFLVFLFLGLSTISIYSSFQGSKLAVNELNNETALVDMDSIQSHYNGKISKVENKIADYQTNKQYQNSEGIILYKVSTKLIPELETERKTYETELSESLENATVTNENRTSVHEAGNVEKGANLGYVTLLCELLLIICLTFGNYYDYRSFVEMVQLNANALNSKESINTNKVNTNSVSIPVYTENTNLIDNEVLELATRKIEADISTYQHKLKNKIGKAETARKRIAELTAKKESMQVSVK